MNNSAPPLWFSILVDGGVTGFSILFLVVLIASFINGRRLRLNPPRAKDRITEVRRHLDATRRVLQELEDDLNDRTKLLERVQADAERYEQLATLNREQARAIENMVDRQFSRQARMAWWQWILSLVAAFILGLMVNWLSGPIGSWLNHL